MVPLQRDATRTKRNTIWTELMAQSPSMEKCILSKTGWQASWIPTRYGNLIRVSAIFRKLLAD